MHSRTTTNRSEVTVSVSVASTSGRRSRREIIKEHLHHPMHHLDQRRDAVRGFSPAWFTASMSTGIVSTLFYNFPYYWDPLRYIGMVVAGFNLLLVIAFTVLFLWRLIQYRDFLDILFHPQISMTLAAIPMAYSTLTTTIATILGWYNLSWAPTLVVVLWAGCVALSLATALLVTFTATSHQGHPFDKVTATLLMPVVSLIVAAAAGSTVASLQTVGSIAVNVIITSYALLAMGLGAALMILTFYFIRLVLFKLPARETVVSSFLPLGPLGQSSNAILVLGTQAQRVFPTMVPHIPLVGDILFSLGFIIGLFLWALAIWWLAHAIYGVIYTRTTGRVPFNLGWWALIFPAGTFATGTYQLWLITEHSFFRVLAAILTAAIVLLWVVVMVNTFCYAWTGELLKPVSIGHLELQDNSEMSTPSPPSPSPSLSPSPLISDPGHLV
ncbi:Plasma membrane sulfite pump involved in sulfite metabolism [Coemansia spiralis]|nr:Plasma membrane sulfite pump involved in sulfite metabolism [Coemansia spiralis]